MRTINALLAPCVLFSLVAGCKSTDKPEPVRPETTTRTPAASASDDPDLVTVTVLALDIDTRLAQLCGISSSKVYFKFDSAKVRPDAKVLLDEIAVCAKSGAARGKDLRVIGRTDPRGSASYNMGLGMECAEAVAKYLREQGVAAARAESVSKGEADGNPDHPWAWPYDRRVTVRLDGDG